MEAVILIIVAAGGLIGVGVLGIFGLTLVDRFKQTPVGSRELRQRLDDLEQRLTQTQEQMAQLSQLDERILDLDERLEFTEHLLKQPSDGERIPPGRS